MPDPAEIIPRKKRRQMKRLEEDKIAAEARRRWFCVPAIVGNRNLHRLVVVVKAEADTQAQVHEAGLQPSTSYLFDLSNDLILEIIDHLYHYACKVNLGLTCRRAMQALATITLQVPDHSPSPYTKYFQIRNQMMALPWKINFTTQPLSSRQKCSLCERRMTTDTDFWAAFFVGLPEAKQRGVNERGRWDANVMKWCEHDWEGSEGMVMKVHCPICMHWPLYHKYSGRRERAERRRLILEEQIEGEESPMPDGGLGYTYGAFRY